MQRTNKLRLYKGLKELLSEQECSKRTAYSIMTLVYETFYHPDRQIASVWDVEDIYSLRPLLNHEQAMQVLLQADYSQDANMGINWEVLETIADELFPQQ